MKEWTNGNAQFAVTYMTLKKETQIMVLIQGQVLRVYLMIGFVLFVELEKMFLRRSD